MSGQSRVCEQGLGVEGSDKPSANDGVSFKAGKNVRLCSPSASSSLPSASKSHKIFGSMKKKIF